MVIRSCIKCGTYIGDRGINCVRCVECQEKHRKKLNRKLSRNYLKKKRQNRAPRCLTELGTTDFSCHKKDNDEDEAVAIKKEMKKLGLRK